MMAYKFMGFFSLEKILSKIFLSYNIFPRDYHSTLITSLSVFSLGIYLYVCVCDMYMYQLDFTEYIHWQYSSIEHIIKTLFISFLE